jgi:hypothetical protein
VLQLAWLFGYGESVSQVWSCWLDGGPSCWTCVGQRRQAGAGIEDALPARQGWATAVPTGWATS